MKVVISIEFLQVCHESIKVHNKSGIIVRYHNFHPWLHKWQIISVLSYKFDLRSCLHQRFLRVQNSNQNVLSNLFIQTKQTIYDNRDYFHIFYVNTPIGMFKVEKIHSSQPICKSYDGEYLDKKRHGTGKSLYLDGSVYDGEWQSDSRYGFGLMKYPDGSTYEGEWKNDLKHGYGVYIYANGDKYEGQWYHDARHGVGTYAHSEEDCSFHGTWNAGQRIGPAEIRNKNYRFHTNWMIDRPVGESAFTFNCDTMITGFMDATDPDGINGGDGDFQWYTGEITKYDRSKLPAAPSIHQFGDHLDDELLHEIKNVSELVESGSFKLECEDVDGSCPVIMNTLTSSEGDDLIMHDESMQSISKDFNSVP